MTAKEELLREILDLDEADAARAHIVISDASVEETEMAPLPAGWGETLTGEPMPRFRRCSMRSLSAAKYQMSCARPTRRATDSVLVCSTGEAHSQIAGRMESDYASIGGECHRVAIAFRGN